ncbi:MAG: nicotinate-nucleotide adenylyltransferase [Ignavibacteriae bacterium]|nr:nicotinate-nucleotide adenylyltransferase [Ignavibacteriota bacterium]
MALSKKREPKRKVARIGLFGGTFDPPHIGHLIIAQQALAQLKLDRVIFVPASTPPHKRKKAFTKPVDRLKMVRLAVRGAGQFRVTDIEIRRKGVSYTVDTVKEIHRRNKKTELFLIIGSDNFAEFQSWKSYDEILKLAKLAVYARFDKEGKHDLRKRQVHWLQGILLDISSSEIRNAVRRNQSVRHLLPAAVERYIESHKLYHRV